MLPMLESASDIPLLNRHERLEVLKPLKNPIFTVREVLEIPDDIDRLRSVRPAD